MIFKKMLGSSKELNRLWVTGSKLCLPFMLAILFVSSGFMSKVHAGEVKSAYVHLARGMPALLHEPVESGAKSKTGILILHPSADVLLKPTWAEQLAKRGYRVLSANSAYNHVGMTSDYDWDELLLQVSKAVAYLRNQPGIEKVILWGNSGGGAMMSAYQNIASNGLAACQGPEKIIKCSDSLADLPAADGLILFDPMFGYGPAVLMNLDPAIIDEDNPQKLNPKLDMFDPKNGYKADGTTEYSDEFMGRYFAGQKKRMDKLIAKALDRLEKIEAGKGNYLDDEPFVVPGGAFLSLKLPATDIRLWSGTRNAYPLLRADSSITTEVIKSVRALNPPTSSATPKLMRNAGGSALNTTVRRFLSTFATRSSKHYGYDADTITGIDWSSSYNSLPGSLEGVKEPVLIVGMTGFFLVSGIELAYEHSSSADKTLVYVEGGDHHGEPCKQCEKPAIEYGDTVKHTFDYIDAWLSKAKRF